MKRKLIFLATSAIISTFLVSLYAYGHLIGNHFAGSATLNANISKQTFLLGEAVKIKFEFVNSTQSTAMIPSGGVEVGSLKVFLANVRDGIYKEYQASDWGRKRGRWISLEPGKTYEYPETVILWNGKPKVPHLNDEAARRALADEVATEYAFQEPGVYLIKGVSYIGETATPVESEPIRIEIKNPEGEDLQVWNQIKGDKEISRLMQNGSFDTDREDVKAQLTDKVEKILAEHPTSVYSSYLRPNLEKFKEGETRRKQYLDKATKHSN